MWGIGSGDEEEECGKVSGFREGGREDVGCGVGSGDEEEECGKVAGLREGGRADVG